MYTSELLHQKIHQWQCSKVVTWYRQRHVISILLCHWWKFWSRDLSLRFSKFYIYEFSYNFNFNTVLNQFLETGTSDKTFMGRDQELKILAFSLYPLSFFLYCPFNILNTCAPDKYFLFKWSTVCKVYIIIWQGGPGHFHLPYISYSLG